MLSSVVGEEGLSAADRQLLRFGERMDDVLLRQDDRRRTLEETFDLGWMLLAELPDETLVRLSDTQIENHIKPHRHDP
jgi:V/A-type H+-transporting ATPase subunit B